MTGKRIFSILLTICLTGSIGGCAFFQFPSGESNSDLFPNSSSTNEVQDTNYKLVENGKSEYKMVLPDEAREGEDWASWELEELFYEATSITLPTVYESEITYSEDAKLIVLGDTAYTEETDVNVSLIPQDGFVLKTVGSNIFILGNNYGVLYGVYEFLSKTLGYEYYIADEYVLDKGVKNLYLPDFNYSIVPDFATRVSGWHGSNRERTESQYDSFMYYRKSPFHNTFQWFPKETYESEHSGWYSNDGSQLCYTAHGNASELALMQETLLEQFKEDVTYYYGKGLYEKTAISFTQEDNTSWCSCSACRSVINATGANSGTLIRFLNPVARDLKAWMNQNYPGREVSILFFAYNASEAAPVKKNSAGEIVPADSSVKMEDNLAVWLALPSMDYLRSIYAPENNVSYQKLKNWSTLSKTLYIWGYDTNFVHYLMWYDTFGTLQDFYDCIRDFGAVYVFNQGQVASNTSSTAFDSLKAALNNQLMWDVDIDLDAYTNRFFDAYFGAASKDMKAYYDSFREWSAYLINEKSWCINVNGGSRLYDRYKKSEFPKDKLNEWLGYIEDAYKSIEGLKTTNKARYKVLHNRINAESIAIRYALIQLHGDTYQRDTLIDMKLLFEEDATSLHFRRKSELEDITTLYREWGLY